MLSPISILNCGKNKAKTKDNFYSGFTFIGVEQNSVILKYLPVYLMHFMFGLSSLCLNQDNSNMLLCLLQETLLFYS